MINNLINDWIFNYSLLDTVHMIIAYNYYSDHQLKMYLTNYDIYNIYIKPHISKLTYYYQYVDYNEVLEYINYIMYFLNCGTLMPSLFVKKDIRNKYVECKKNEAQWQLKLPDMYYGNIETFKKAIDFDNIIDFEKAISSLYLSPYLRRC